MINKETIEISKNKNLKHQKNILTNFKDKNVTSLFFFVVVTRKEENYGKSMCA